MMQAKPQDAADNSAKLATLEETIDEMKALIRPGYWGEIGIRVSLKDGLISWIKLEASRSRQ